MFGCCVGISNMCSESEFGQMHIPSLGHEGGKNG